jgi:hypothetical protein
LGTLLTAGTGVFHRQILSGADAHVGVRKRPGLGCELGEGLGSNPDMQNEIGKI